MRMNSPSADKRVQWDSALSHWESEQADCEATVQLWPLKDRNAMEELLGTDGACLIALRATAKEHENLNWKLNLLQFMCIDWHYFCWSHRGTGTLWCHFCISEKVLAASTAKLKRHSKASSASVSCMLLVLICRTCDLFKTWCTHEILHICVHT